MLFNSKMLGGKMETIILIGTMMMLTIGLINLITPFFQNASALSLQGTLDKLFGGLFYKSLPKQAQEIQQQHIRQNTNTQSINATSPRVLSSLIIPTGCHIVNGGLPDPKCTPGAINPTVTQDNIHNTICVAGYSKNVRPPISYTAPLKMKLMKSYGLTDSRSNYEFDHLISLEIGGNPIDVKNLWPEPGYGQYNFHVKDRFENYLHKAVCNGSMSLSEVQKQIANDWISNWMNAGQP